MACDEADNDDIFFDDGNDMMNEFATHAASL